MLLLENGLVTQSLDSHLDIEKFLSLEDEFYYLFASNYDKTWDVWNAGGIPFDINWEYLDKSPMLYKTLHKVRDLDPMISKFDNKAALAYYLKLKYKCFSPYKILHLNVDGEPIKEWVTPAIQDWIKSLPFETVDLVSLFYNDHFCPLKYHRDYDYFPVEEGWKGVPDTLQDVIWFRFDLSRGFNFYDIDSNGNILSTYPVEGYSSTFNHYNWHGNTEIQESSSITVKVEGKFTEEFRKKIYG